MPHMYYKHTDQWLDVLGAGEYLAATAMGRDQAGDTFDANVNMKSHEGGDFIKIGGWLSDYHQKLKIASSVEDDWNGLGSTKPNMWALRCAKDILIALYELGFKPSDIVPSAEEGITFVFEEQSKYAFIECYNEGDIAAGYSSPDDGSVLFGEERQNIKQMISRVKSYF